MRVAALCAGYGGLELGLQLAGVEVDMTWYAEIDKHASRVMAAHNPTVPNLGDLTTIENPPEVDIMTAGFPCQPVSVAGKRAGINDERWLIDDVCSLARRAGANWLILENVGGLLSANNGQALARVVAALAANGFSAEWTCVRASDVGAPHRRLRWYCVAYTYGVRRDKSGRDAGELGAAQGGRAASLFDRHSSDGPTDINFDCAVADTNGRRHGGTQDSRRMGSLDPCDERPSRIGQRSRQVAEHRSSVASNADVLRQERCVEDGQVEGRQLGGESQGVADAARWGEYAVAIARWERTVGRAAPDATDDRRRLSARFVEWMMGLDDGWVTNTIGKPVPSIKCLGNGVVPQQAAYAIKLLTDQIEADA